MKKNIYILSIVISLLSIISGKVHSQCSNFGSQYPTSTQTTTSNTLINISTCMFGGDYAVCDVTAGETYTWTTCGDTDFDTQLSLWNTSHTTSYAYNDDDCGSQSTITWTATFTGQVHVLVSRYYCNDESTCMTLQWACTSCGTGSVITTCSGTFTDTGGASGNYSNNEDYTVTYCPGTSGSKIQMNFTSFDVETNYDYLTVYDGDNTSAPSLGTYDNSLPLSGIVSATGSNTSGCLTFVFHSDVSNAYDGWEASISCVNNCQAVLIGSVTTNPAYQIIGGIKYVDICQGQEVTFTATGSYPENGGSYTQSDATSTFEWNFGDGHTATGATVTHTYLSAQGYDVDLKITDVNGCTNSDDLGVRVRISTTPNFSGTNITPNPVCAGNPVSLNGNVSTVTATMSYGGELAGTTYLPDGSGVSYDSDLEFSGFSPSQTITSINDILSICINMEHSYMGDLSMMLMIILLIQLLVLVMIIAGLQRQQMDQ